MAETCRHDPRTNRHYLPRTIYPCPACGKDVRAGEPHIPEGGSVHDVLTETESRQRRKLAPYQDGDTLEFTKITFGPVEIPEHCKPSFRLPPLSPAALDWMRARMLQALGRGKRE